MHGELNFFALHRQTDARRRPIQSCLEAHPADWRRL
jgi:hypothetical protein